MSVFAPALGALWRQLEGYGIDPAPLFREEGVEPELIFDAGARVPVDRYQRLDERAAELSGDPYFGLRGAEYFRPAHLGPLGFAWLASSSLRTAFLRLSRYARVIQEKLTIDLSEDDRHYYVSVDAHLPVLNQKIREDGQLAAIIKFCRVIAGDQFNPVRLCFRQEQPPQTAYHYELFRCPIEFGADTIVNRVKAAIIDGLANGAVSEVSVAEELHMTPRNLHRKLQKENTSFKVLLTEVRKELAQQYIQDRSKTLTEISYLLGFSEASSFSRAYKGWTGHAPSEARREVA
jgi:AraC-like DNA-binding protein